LPDGEIQALLFDFNGTLADDAPDLLRIYRQITSEMGLPFPESLIPMVMALPDADIFPHLLGAAGWPADNVTVGRLIERRRRLYAQRAANSPPITSQRRQLIRNLASYVPVGVVSGAFSHEINAVLTAAGLDDVMTAVVCIDHVTRGKPDPEGWLLGLAKINTRAAQPIAPNRVLAIDDSADGLRGARRAGMRTAAVSNGVMPAPQAEADFVLGALDEDAEAILLAAVTARSQPGRAHRPPHAAADRDQKEQQHAG
jgi:beta-phosphoglucomutase